MRSTNPFRKITKHENLSIFMVLLIIIAAVILVEFFVVRSMDISAVAFIKPMNISNVFLQVSITGMMALSMTFIMISGHISLDTKEF